MTEFLDFLSVYYFCDAMASLRQLTSAEYMGCMDTYEAVKRYFAPDFELAPRGTPERVEQMRAAYLGFVGWQEANADLVEIVRVVGVVGEAPQPPRPRRRHRSEGRPR